MDKDKFTLSPFFKPAKFLTAGMFGGEGTRIVTVLVIN